MRRVEFVKKRENKKPSRLRKMEEVSKSADLAPGQ